MTIVASKEQADRILTNLAIKRMGIDIKKKIEYKKEMIGDEKTIKKEERKDENEKFILYDTPFHLIECVKCHKQNITKGSRDYVNNATASKHSGCGGQVKVLDIKLGLSEDVLPFFEVGEKIRNHFNPCRNNCYYNKHGSSFKNEWVCPQTAENIIMCQNYIIYDRIKKSPGTVTDCTRDVDYVDVKYSDEKVSRVYVEDIRRLFVIRNCFSKQDPNNYKSFGVMKLSDGSDEPLSSDTIVDSLESKITIGVHQLSKSRRVKWICYDIDKRDDNVNTRDLADSIVKYLKEWYGLTGYIEMSGSPDSYHVWIFFEHIEAEKAYSFNREFELRLKREGVPVEYIKEEPVPLGGKGYGKMIKLPFNIQRKNGNMSRFVGDIDISKIRKDVLPDIKGGE